MSLRRLGQPFRRKGGHSNESESPLVHAVKERTITRPPVDSFDVEGFDFERSHGIKIWEDNSQDSQESDQDDNALAEDVEITEGGWICRVERFEKHVDSEGRVHYRRPRKENSSPVVDQDVTDAQKPVTLDQGEKDNYVQQSIISYFSHSTKTDSKDLIDPDMYIEIKSPLILEVLRENTSYGQESLRGKKVTFHEPYPLLWHQYHALETYSKNQSKPKDHRAHIRVLLDFLRSCAMPNVPELIELCNPENSIRNQQSSDLSYSRVFQVDNVRPPSRKIDRKGRFIYGTLILNCQQVEYDGTVLEFQLIGNPIEPFEGVVPYSELRFMPLKLLEEHEEKRHNLICRGQKFWDLRGQHMKEFVDGSYANRSLVENERVMVDWAMHARQEDTYTKTAKRLAAVDNDSTLGTINYQPRAEGRVQKTPKRSLSPLTQDEKPGEDVLILCDYLVWGFSFRSKQWDQYHVDDLIDVDFNKRSFDRLVLREEYKTILKAMVAQHFTQGQNRFRDLVAGKGQGLNILLHGPPGVGKTLTAECIADLYERPLYSVTSGDIGTNPEDIENKLHKIFNYAVNWNAVLLLDEADVFLAERNLENLSRNALVSVFLRNIEYFNGIFFLTTNRVGTIDEAFQSRLHITLGLDPLSVDDRRQIWYYFIKDLKHLSKDDRRILARHARDDWSHKDFNGRQIRNAVKTALTLARQDGVEVQVRHFQVVLDIGTRFAGYMQRLKKMDRERLAEAIGTRLDLTTNTLQSPESPTIAHIPKRKSDDEAKRLEKKDPDLDWD